MRGSKRNRARRTGPTATAVALLVAVSTLGCGTTGEMGNGTFWYACSSGGSSDVACDLWASARSIPDRIAVDAPFRVTFEPHPSQVQPGLREQDIEVVAASPERMAGAGGSFRLLEPGTHSLIARTDEGTALDYVHLEGRVVSALALYRDVLDPVESLVLSVGATAWLEAVPEDEAGAELAGRLTYAWHSAEPSVASLLAGSSERHRGIHGEAAGTTTVEVWAGPIWRAVDVEVTP